jgi:Rod binding domain-containing protein
MSALPPIDSALLPADIRNGSQDRKNAYEAGLSFEQMLVQQLAKSLADTTQTDTSDDSTDDSTDSTGGSDAATQTYTGMLPDALTDGIMSAGGLGIARSLMPPDTEASQ